MPEGNQGVESGGRSFRDAYGVLQRHAESLRAQDEPNIDDLLTIVTESVEAYRVCKERIDAVEAALKAALDGVGVGSPASSEGTRTSVGRAPQATQISQPPADPELMDDDVPF